MCNIRAFKNYSAAVSSCDPTALKVVLPSYWSCCRFLSRDAYATYTHSEVCWLAIYRLVSVCLCLSPSGILSKRLNGTSWFGVHQQPSACPTLFFNRIRICPNIRVLYSVAFYRNPKVADFSAFSPRHVNRRQRFQLTSTVAGLSQRASAVVYSMFIETQNFARYVCKTWHVLRWPRISESVM